MHNHCQIRSLFFIVFLLVLSNLAFSQVTRKDYERADSTKYLNNLVFHTLIQSDWIDSTYNFWYKKRTRKGIEFILYQVKSKKAKLLFDTEQFLMELNQLSGKNFKPDNIPIRDFKLNQELSECYFSLGKEKFTYSLKTSKLKKTGEIIEKDEPYWGNSFDELNNQSVSSPDSQYVAYIKDYNIYIKKLIDTTVFQLSFDGSEGEYYSSYIQWSPDSKKIITLKVRPNVKRYMYFVESTPESQFLPKLHQKEYLRAGDALPVRLPVLFDIETRRNIPIDGSKYLDQYSIDNLKWAANSEFFTFEYNQRGHQLYQVILVYAATGKQKSLIIESSNTFIDYSGKRYRYDLKGNKEIIWASERDGWNHIYLFNGISGDLINQVTKGEWVVRGVEFVDEDKRQIIFKASGMNKDEDPYFIHYYRINFDGTDLVELTPEKLNHRAMFSFDYSFFIDSYSSANVPEKSVLKETKTGKVLTELETSDISALLAKGYTLPEPFVAKARDNETAIWGNIYRPMNFDSSKKYPIIEYIYAGPQSSYVQKSFQPYNYRYASLAELGFIVVQIDGMGTSNRSKAFHDVCYKNLKDAGFEDRILWIKAAAKKYQYMDITRIGIYGGSAGGQNSTAGLLFHPEFYKVGVSSCGCHDNRVDKIWWNEQWMGYPVEDQYKACSNIENAHLLEGKLMLIVGELDDNVDPSSTYRLANSLIKHNKNFELVVLPGVNHTLGGKYGEHKRRDFFVKHLLNQEPPNWND